MTGICAIPATLLVVAFQLGFGIAVIALNAFLFLITGHAILRLTNLAVYSEFSIRSSIEVGAVGGAIIFPAFAVFNIFAENCLGIKTPEEGDKEELIPSVARNILTLGMGTAFGAASGGIGSKVLLSHGLSVMDPVHAARAGALGGAVLGPGILVGVIL
jgi:hypothetical protein